MNIERTLQDDRIILFGRYPVPGKTKTRLVPVLGPAGAADLQRRLTEKIFQTVRSFSSHRDIEVEFRFESGNKCKMERWLGPGVILSSQGTGDLGKRMRTAIFEAFQSGCRRVVLLGTDIPEVNIDHLKPAFYALSEHGLTLGPSTDGGYWLIGLKHPVDLFENINWGTETVFDKTVALAKRQGLKVHLLEQLTDIDTEEDFQKWSSEKNVKRPYISVIIPALNESTNIKETIHRAQGVDAEIIVVDGGSTDDTVKQATKAAARVEISPPGRAVQQNWGASIAKGHVFLFLHADTHLPDDYISHVFETLMDPGIALGAFRFKTDFEKPLMKIIEFITNIRSRYLKLPYGDQGLFMRSSVFESAGGFPEVPIAEDLFLVRRLFKQGNICIAPVYAVTSARRWRTLGLFRTTLINLAILAGCYLGFPPHVIAKLHRSYQKT